jgi:predicted kinase
MTPSLIVFAGLPGTGKSTLALEIARRQRAVWLRVDTAEAAMLRAGLARSDATGLAAYIVVRDVAAAQLRLGQSVVVDAVNAVEEAREMWRDLASEQGVDRFVVEVVCSDVTEHRRRVESRAGPTPPLPAPTWEEVRTREYLPWTEPILTVDSVVPVDQVVAQIQSYLTHDPGKSPRPSPAHPGRVRPARPRQSKRETRDPP